MATPSSKAITVPLEVPAGSCWPELLKAWPELLKALPKGHLPSREIIDWRGMSFPAPPAPPFVHKTKKSDSQLSDTVEALRTIYPNGGPASINRPVMAKKVEEHLGRYVSPSTIDRARKLAWPR